jgi:hypothetical protein
MHKGVVGKPLFRTCILSRMTGLEVVGRKGTNYPNQGNASADERVVQASLLIACRQVLVPTTKPLASCTRWQKYGIRKLHASGCIDRHTNCTTGSQKLKICGRSTDDGEPTCTLQEYIIATSKRSEMISFNSSSARNFAGTQPMILDTPT